VSQLRFKQIITRTRAKSITATPTLSVILLHVTSSSTSQSRNSLPFIYIYIYIYIYIHIKHGGSLSRSQKPATDPRPRQTNPIHTLGCHICKIPQLSPIPSGLFTPGLSTKMHVLYISRLHATHPAQFILYHHTKRSSTDANILSATQEITRLLW
jgi:hypothetical protein